MATAAPGERFEEAASLRDQVRTLERLETPQKITTTDSRSATSSARTSRATAPRCRSSRCATARWWRARASCSTAGRARDAPARRIQQFYAQGRYVPREVLVPRSVPDCDAARGMADGARGRPVRIRVPQRGEKVRLLELVVRNARLAFDLEWSHPRKQSQEILRALRDLLDLEIEPRASSASTSRTSRAPTSWLRWCASRTGCRRSPTTGSSGSAA
jgi:excinuclease ABC subunit C